MGVPGRDLGWRDLLRSLVRELREDDVLDVAAAVTFFGVLALFPFLLFLVSLASLIIDPATANSLVEQLARVAPRAVTDILGERIRALGERSSAGLLTLGAALALWSASGGVMALMRALNRAFDVQENRPYWKTRGIALLVTLAVASLGLLAMLAVIATPALVRALGPDWLAALLQVLSVPLAGLLVALSWALLFHFLPNAHQRFRVFSPGAIVGVLLWLVASWLFSLYVSRFGNYDAVYGAIGGVIILLLWMLITALTFLLGAEINNVLYEQGQRRARA